MASLEDGIWRIWRIGYGEFAGLDVLGGCLRVGTWKRAPKVSSNFSSDFGAYGKQNVLRGNRKNWMEMLGKKIGWKIGLEIGLKIGWKIGFSFLRRKKTH